MDSLSTFLAMGGYGAFVWPSFAMTLVVLGALLVLNIRFLRANQSRLETLRDARAKDASASPEAASET